MATSGRVDGRLERAGQADERGSGPTREGHLGNGPQVVSTGRNQSLFETVLSVPSAVIRMSGSLRRRQSARANRGDT